MVVPGRFFCSIYYFKDKESMSFFLIIYKFGLFKTLKLTPCGYLLVGWTSIPPVIPQPTSDDFEVIE
jgi:hypothetical protein